VLASLSIEQRVGQLLLAGFPGLDSAGAAIAIGELHAGGIVLGGGRNAAETQAATAVLQGMALASGSPPLLIAIDQEGYPVQRITEGVTTFGANWQIGEMTPRALGRQEACARGLTHGRELSSLGVNVNLAPVLDVWDNPANTVIAFRSYSDDPQVVATLGSAYIEALQSQGMLAVAKHFPGHGSAAGDSHLMMPSVGHDRAWLLTHELVPFQAAIRSHVSGVMTAHVAFPQIDSVPNRPATFSPDIVYGLLRQELGFDGLIVTDDIGAMQAVTERYEPGDAAVRALQAGVDVLNVVGPIASQRQMVQAVLGAIGTSISAERLDASVRRVLRAKLRVSLIGPARANMVTVPLSCAAA
jgi:beta-N-acetylhexosaminidase